MNLTLKFRWRQVVSCYKIRTFFFIKGYTKKQNKAVHPLMLIGIYSLIFTTHLHAINAINATVTFHIHIYVFYKAVSLEPRKEIFNKWSET